MAQHRIRNRFDLTGRVAVITGSSKGIGEAMARGLAEFGAHVVVSSRDQKAVDAVAEGYRADGLQATAIACHVGDADDRRRLIEQTVASCGRLDILINNAATNPYFGPIEGLTAEAYQKTLDVNLTAALELSNLALPHLRKSGHGSVIHISSIEGLHANPNFAAYNISKAGVIMLGKSQAREWAVDNVRVNVICPGLVKTKLSRALWENEQLAEHFVQSIPLGRMAVPDELAGLACWLAGEGASYVTGGVFVADGGML
ncbi:SDR family NAD(P)-dependent oxidoreductase [Lewinella sp. IMCC34183]|uniref:SDR family NAD(P)-dependent oxidoreductase n=1 Tax=Lewinella sp. IMCC34183 TaxID=2248762 RepID=UPI001E613D6A|nr:glucose 1-dehydrogenase [Lewinella sp. IMCC34183]